MSHLARRPAVRRRMVTTMARARTKAAPRPRPHSWGHALVQWSDGTRREGWLRADDAMDFTASAVAAVIRALACPDLPVGAFTPAAAFGPQIAVDAGGELLLPPTGDGATGPG